MRKSLIELIFIMILRLLWVLNPILFSFVSSKQSLNFGPIEKADIRLLKNELVALKLSPERNMVATTFDSPINSFESSIHEIEEVSSLALRDIKIKTIKGKNSIFVESFQVIENFPIRPKLNYDDALAILIY